MKNNAKREDYVYFVYDVVLDEEGKIRLDYYEAYMQVDGKDRKYVFDHKKSTYPENLSSEIGSLRLSNYISMNEIKPSLWDVMSVNPLINMKLFLLSKNHKIIEKAYDGTSTINEYIYYVNVKNGQEYVMCIGTEKYSMTKTQVLQKQGFKPIEDSILLKEAILGQEEKKTR